MRYLWVFLLACGCTTTPRYATDTIIPSLKMSSLSIEDAMAELTRIIHESHPTISPIRLDMTPTVVYRTCVNKQFIEEMNELEARYRNSLPLGINQSVTIHFRNISISDACSMVALVAGYTAVVHADGIIFRIGPEVARFRAYKASPKIIDALKTTPNSQFVGMHRPPPWRDDQMMSIDEGQLILFIGSDIERKEFKTVLKTEKRNAQHNPPDGRVEAPRR